MANKKNNKGFKLNLYWMYAIIIGGLLAAWFFGSNVATKSMSMTEFEKMVKSGGVSKIIVYTGSNEAEAVLNDSLARVVFKDQNYQPQRGVQAKAKTDIPSSDKFTEMIEAWKEAGYFKGEVSYEKGSDYGSWIWSFGPLILLVVFWVFIMRRMGNGGVGGGGGIFSVGKSRAMLFDKNNSNKVTFEDVAGLAEAKVEVAEIVDFLKNPGHYTELGGKIPKGALLVGPPGTGKTLLAKAVAGEANVPFFSMSGSDFVEMFVGVGASRVRDLFRQAKEKAPCIVFIDEIDAVGRARGKNSGMGGNDERENTLNQLLTEMDGFGSNSGVIILAATNRADILDTALLRAGRFDRQIYVELPELSDRKEIFQVHLRNVKTDGSVDIDLLSRQTPGFSGADIANVCNEAALIAARRKKKAVQRQDFMDAIDRIIGGLEKKSKVITEEERRSIAVHEAGHATVSWHLQYADPLIKVTIVPRGKALGAAWYMPEERQIEPKQALLDKMCSLLAGRMAEEMFLGFIDTGALNDLERATKMAYAMVTFYGMSDKLPNISYYDSSGQSYGFTKPYSEDRAKAIDDEVQAIIDSQYQRARDILEQYTDGHHELADLLVQREVIYTEDAERIFGKRKWLSRTDEIIKANEESKRNEEIQAADDSESDTDGKEIPPIPTSDVPEADGEIRPPVFRKH
ncbi:MAG: ATP-dependent zinc metalloprotease FtsH [Muribaculaceae bacterium]|nr:ATP-dependent zinc metalloprotease FtsH [Muribaculaceae bacterium]